MNYWLEMLTEEQASTYLQFLQNLTDEERQIYIMGKDITTGKIGMMLGASDIEEYHLCICGNEPLLTSKSEQIWQKMLEIEDRWRKTFIKSGVGERAGSPSGNVRVEFGMRALAENALCGDRELDIYRDDYFDQKNKRDWAITGLLLDLEQLESSIHQWFEKNRHSVSDS